MRNETLCNGSTTLKSESADGHKDSSEQQLNTNISNHHSSKAIALNQIKSCTYDHLKSQTYSSYRVIVPFFQMIFPKAAG